MLLKSSMQYLFILFSLFLFWNCAKTKSGQTDEVPASSEPFEPKPVQRPVVPEINETSGIADSRVNPGYLWVQEDSGNPPEITLLHHDGTILKSIYIKGAHNRDWEEMTIAGDELYVGEIGDNQQIQSDYAIYHFPEPHKSVDTVHQFSIIRFRYPDGSHDAEAFLVDETSKDIFIITKRDKLSEIYQLKYPYSYTSMNTAEHVGSLKYSGVVGAAIDPDNKEIIIKTYTNLFRYLHSNGATIPETLAKSFTSVPYQIEAQGEAVTFAADNSGFFTLSEKGFLSSVNLNFYKRK